MILESSVASLGVYAAFMICMVNQKHTLISCLSTCLHQCAVWLQ